MWPPITSSRSDSPRKVAQRLPAASVRTSTGSSASFAFNHSRARVHVGVKATRCAPFSSPVSARNSFRSATTRPGFRVAFMFA